MIHRGGLGTICCLLIIYSTVYTLVSIARQKVENVYTKCGYHFTVSRTSNSVLFIAKF